jgi:hypothetical protein
MKAYILKGSYSHAFGAVFGCGTTLLGGPYSYAVVIIHSIDDLECMVDGKNLEGCNLIHSDQGCSINMVTGRLVAVVLAWHRNL